MPGTAGQVEFTGGDVLMTLMRRPSPFGEMMSLRQAMDRLFEDSFIRSPFWSTTAAEGSLLPVDVSTTADALVIEAALPGVSPEDVEITVESGTLTISGSYRTERDETEGEYIVRELRRGSFSRVVSLPDGLDPDKAEATFEHGLLELRIPKTEQVKPRQIRITPSSGNGQASLGESERTTQG
jgi:HSP20 family protein